MSGAQMIRRYACAIAAMAAFFLNGAVGQTPIGSNLQENDTNQTNPNVERRPAATRNSDLGEVPLEGNPLWGIPMSSLSAMRERPLFSTSRRPPVLSRPGAEAPPLPLVEPEHPPFTLVGTAIGKMQNVAVILDPTTKNLVRLHSGEAASQWNLRSVDLRSVMVEKQNQAVVLPLSATGAKGLNGRAYDSTSDWLSMSSGTPSRSTPSLTLDTTQIANGGGTAVAMAASPTRTFTAYHIGNSLTEDLFYDFRTVATRYEATQDNTYAWGFHFRPGTSLTFMYKYPTPPATPYPTISGVKETDTSRWPTTNLFPWPVSLPGNHWDVVTMEPFPGGGTDGAATLGSDTAAINAMIALTKTRADNASTRFFIYEAWPAVKYGDLNSYSTAWLTPMQNNPGAASALNRNYFTHLVSAVRQTNPNVEVIPVGEVLYALDMKMRAGQFQGFYSIIQLHRDAIHLNSVGQNVTSWTAYAAIFIKSPVGLRNDVLGNAAVSPFTNVTAISPADMLLMQQTVWDVVSSHLPPQHSPHLAHQ
jgi:hypothetical protein